MQGKGNTYEARQTRNDWTLKEREGVIRETYVSLIGPIQKNKFTRYQKRLYYLKTRLNSGDFGHIQKNMSQRNPNN